MARYVIAATLARVCDGGAIVAVVLLVNTSGGSPTVAGLLGACVTAPHLFAPLVARRLDTGTVAAGAAAAHGPMAPVFAPGAAIGVKSRVVV